MKYNDQVDGSKEDSTERIESCFSNGAETGQAKDFKGNDAIETKAASDDRYRGNKSNVRIILKRAVVTVVTIEQTMCHEYDDRRFNAVKRSKLNEEYRKRRREKIFAISACRAVFLRRS